MKKRLRTKADTKGEVGKDYILCQECGNRFLMVTPQHLKCHHNMTLVEYKQKYPNTNHVAKVQSDKLRAFLGKTHSVEYRRVCSERVRGKNNPCYGLVGELNPACRIEVRQKLSLVLSGEGNGMYGKKHTLEWRKKHSEDMKKHNPMRRPEVAIKLRGVKNGNWRHGRGYEPYTSAFTDVLKNKIRIRDGHRCQLCSISQEECARLLDVHHIDYVKTNNNEENFVTLCIVCHGKTNTRREYFTESLRALVLEGI